LALFIAGTEIRVRLEDKLLAERFGDEFRDYRRSTPAYIPLIR
jgi:protein-S-isoprenylcysteine O-methyltransferase Ste14